MNYGADLTLLTAPPESASVIATEWTVDGAPGRLVPEPTLRADVFLANIPFGTLNGVARPLAVVEPDERVCAGGRRRAQLHPHERRRRFRTHFSDYWQGDRPFAAANYYYDAVVLLALGLNKGLSETGELPDLKQLHANIRSLGDPDAEPVRWNNLRGPFTEIRLGTEVHYVGAAAEYEFDRYGAAQHTVFDHWEVANDGFARNRNVQSDLPPHFLISPEDATHSLKGPATSKCLDNSPDAFASWVSLSRSGACSSTDDASTKKTINRVEIPRKRIQARRARKHHRYPGDRRSARPKRRISSSRWC